MHRTTTVLGIESSCDDSAAAVVRVGIGGADILSNVVSSQTDLHRDYGGVVPEIAARAHAEMLDTCVSRALEIAQCSPGAMDAVAVTAGPGLIGGLVSGVMLAKGIAAGADLPLIGINHLAGHALTPRLTDNLGYPYLMLLASGGHCQFLAVTGYDRFTRLGGTIDDAPGEAFDKVAKLLGLAQPGGPSVEAAASEGSPSIVLPRPMLDREGCDMSFSGLKTAVLRARDACAQGGDLSSRMVADLAASFQAAVVDIFAQKTDRAFAMYQTLFSGSAPAFAVAGGVAANQEIRQALRLVADTHGVRFVAPPLALCTDNGAMIAFAGAERFLHGKFDNMTLGARSRWPLDASQVPMLGSGKRGPKA